MQYAMLVEEGGARAAAPGKGGTVWTLNTTATSKVYLNISCTFGNTQTCLMEILQNRGLMWAEIYDIPAPGSLNTDHIEHHAPPPAAQPREGEGRGGFDSKKRALGLGLGVGLGECRGTKGSQVEHASARGCCRACACADTQTCCTLGTCWP